MMNRSLVYVVGLGPGGAQYLTAQAQTALQAADVLCGYRSTSTLCARFTRIKRSTLPA